MGGLPKIFNVLTAMKDCCKALRVTKKKRPLAQMAEHQASVLVACGSSPRGGGCPEKWKNR